MISIGSGTVSTSGFLLLCGLTLLVLLGAVCTASLILPLGSCSHRISTALPVRTSLGILAILSLTKLAALVTGSFTIGLTITGAVALIGGIILLRDAVRHREMLRAVLREASLRGVLSAGPLVAVLLAVLVKVTPNQGAPVSPVYDEFTVAIRQTNGIPLANRHFGESLLAAITLFGNEVTVQTARVAINVWLMASLVVFAGLVYVVLRELIADRWLRVAGTYVFLFGTASLSIAPMIIYDHDFPYVFNVYSDSLFGLCGALIALFIAFDSSLSLARRTAALAAVGLGSVSIAELDVPAIVIALAAVIAARALFAGLRTPVSWGVALFAALLLSGVAGSLQGGALMPASWHRVSTGSVGIDWRASELQTAGLPRPDLASAYVPVSVPGVWLDLGNLPAPSTTKSRDHSAFLNNTAALDASSNDPPSTRPLLLLTLIQTRLVGALQILFVPLLGAAVALAFLIRNRGSSNGREPSPLTDLAAAAVGLIVVFVPLEVLVNIPPAGTVTWKWALTRMLEVPVAVSMLFLVIYGMKVFTGTRTSRNATLLIGLLATVPSWVRFYFDFVRQ